ncbi:MAG: DUF3883 domain-containing protein [Bacilli bacterium]|nr:DUF3883 domain-containing protein [Bacilli bacterium]
MAIDPAVVDSFVAKFNAFFRTKMEVVVQKETRSYRLLDQFLKRFAPSKIPSMTLEEYCFAKGKKDTMCYWLDNTLRSLGDIHISGQCGFQKFGIQNIDGAYVFKRINQNNCKYGNTPVEVYRSINEELRKIIKAASDFDVDAVERCILPGVLKSKLTYLYAKEKWIPIYVHTDLNKLLDVFQIPRENGCTLTRKRILLYQFYLEAQKRIPFLTTWEFMHFIYSSEGYRNVLRPEENTSSMETSSMTEEPSPSEEQQEELDFGTGGLTDFVGTYTIGKALDAPLTATRAKPSGPRKPDYEELQRQRARKGLIGETLIVNDEIAKLHNLGVNKTPEHVALVDDSLGYDILSYDESGNPIYIEVKTTTSHRIDGFYLSAKEVEKAIELGGRFRLYRVYDLDVEEKTYSVEIFDGEALFDVFKLRETNFLALLS